MFLRRLRLTSFRNFDKLDESFHQKRVLVTGPNAAGKSSLLEAIVFLGLGSSLRARRDQEVIMRGQRKGLVLGEIISSGKVNHRLAVSLGPNSKSLRLDGKQVALTDFVGFLPLVIFSPADLGLLSGSPSRRRKFLDRFLVLLDREYLAVLASFRKVLQNRNYLLRRKERRLLGQFDYWEEQFAFLGAQIIYKRQQVLRKMGRILKSELPDGFEIRYLPSPRSAGQILQLEKNYQAKDLLREEILGKLKKLRVREESLGFSLIGPQRDDFQLLGRGASQEFLDVGLFGSRGEQRLATISLKKAQLNLLKNQAKRKPILLLDDVFSELDQKNQQRVFDFLDDHQVFIATLAELPFFKQLGNYQLIRLGG